MFHVPRHKHSRILVITNPDSESDGGSDDVRRAQDGRHVPYGDLRRPLPSNAAPHSSFKGPQSLPYPPSLTTSFPNGSPVQNSHPPLSSPSTTSSPAQESTPPPSTPALQVPPVNLTGVGTLPEKAISTSVDRGMSDVPQSSNPRVGKHLPPAKPAFGSRGPRQPDNVSRRLRNVCSLIYGFVASY